MKIKIILAVALFISLVVPLLLSTRIVGIGEGPDEMQHIDNAFFRLRNPGRSLDVEKGFMWPGYAPIGQGHQAPASYLIGAGILRMFFSPAEVPAIVDYAAGISYSSEGAAFGEQSNCSYRLDRQRLKDTRHVRYGIYLLRGLGALYLMGTVYLAWRSGLMFFTGDKTAALAVAFFVLGVPTAIWRSVFFSNDNAVAFFAALTFYLALRILKECRGQDENQKLTTAVVGLTAVAAVIAAITFLCKYNGVVALGFVVVAILLSSRLCLRRRLLLILIAGAIFSVIVLPDLIENLRLDGDLFSLPVVIRDVPYLYRPSSFISVLGDGDFLRELFQRFWLEYHNSGSLQSGFPLWVHNIWIITCLFAVLGLLKQFFPVKNKVSNSVFVLLALSAVVFSVLVIVHFGATFPMPGGRYLHTALLPVACLVVYGWREILFFVFHQRTETENTSPSLVLLLLSAGLAVFSAAFTSYFFYQRYADCLLAEAGNLPAGVSLTQGDFIGDGGDEIAVFHRLRGRVFFLRQEEGRWIPQLTMSRAVGLAGDKIFSADINDDGIDELLLWREVPGFLFVVGGLSFTRPDTSISVYPDRQVKPLLVSGPFPNRSKAQVFYDCRGAQQLMIYQPSSGAVAIFAVKYVGVEQISAKVESEFHIETGAEDIAAICVSGELHFYSAHPAIGMINHRLLRLDKSLPDKSTSANVELVETFPGDSLLVQGHSDWTANQLWYLNFEEKKGGGCFQTLPAGIGANKQFCLTDNASAATAHQWLILSSETGFLPFSIDLFSGRFMSYGDPTNKVTELPASFELFAAP
ncbi:MAG: hypothetical protein PHC51_04660 [bacterium]|nr:hypothetical protein [bacterium]